MNKALNDKAQAQAVSEFTESPYSEKDGLNWRKKMSDNVALALITYTGIHIFATVGAIKTTGFKSLALLALVILVAGIIPACRWFEKRWTKLSDEEAGNPDFAGDFRRDQIALWILAIGLPFLLTGFFTLLA